MSTPLARRQADGAPARRARYLRAAQRLFAAHGFAGTSTDMIVAEVGGSKATLYKYFPTKEALVAGLIADVVERMSSAQGGLDVADLPLREALMRFGRATLGAVVSDPALDMLRLSLGEHRRFPELAAAVWTNGPAVTYANFRRFLRERCERGELDVPDEQLAAEHFLAAIAGHIQLKVAMGMAKPPSKREVERRVAAATETFLARYGT